MRKIKLGRPPPGGEKDWTDRTFKAIEDASAIPDPEHAQIEARLLAGIAARARYLALLLAKKQPLSAILTALSSLSASAGFLYQTGASTFTKFSMVGMVAAFPSTSVPSGWLPLDGSNRSRTVRAALFAYLGTTFGIGDGSTTFGTPDARAKTIFGYDALNATGLLTLSATGGLSASTIGNTGGEQAHQITLAELASHAHVTSGNRITNATATGAVTVFQALAAGSTGSNQATGTSIGSDTAHNTVPPGIVFQWCIFAGA